MYVARFSYSIKPVDRDRAIALLAQGLAAARTQEMGGWLFIPVTRPAGGAALEVQVELSSLDQLETFRERGMGSADETRAWMQELSGILLEPPAVELLRVADVQPETQGGQA